jgi:uridine phosphorylase
VAIGDLVVSTGALKNEGTSRMYVPDGFPAVPDLDLTVALVAAARSVAAERGIGVHVGLGASDDAFYAETPEQIARMSALGLLNVEMEASALYTVGHLRGLRVGMVCAVSGNLVTDDVVYEGVNQGLTDGWEAAIDTALRAVLALAG